MSTPVPFVSDVTMNNNQIKEFVLELISNPTTPANGRIWFDADRPKVSVIGVTKTIAYVGDTMSPSAHVHPISDVTGLQTSLDSKQATITGAASSVTVSDLGVNMAMITDDHGKIAASSSVTKIELEYLDGVSGAIQGQLDNKIPLSQRGANNGVATLDSTGKVPSSQLPGSIDDVLEAANLAALIALAASEKMSNRIYIAVDTNITYRWTGTVFTEISSTIACGNSTGVIGTASTDSASTASRSDHTHSIATHAIDNTKLSTMPAKSVKANVASLPANVGDVTINMFGTSILDECVSVAKISRSANPEITVTGGIGTWTITGQLDANRISGTYYSPIVQVYKLGTTVEQVWASVTINNSTGTITISMNSSSATITAGTYIAVITQ